MDETQSIPLTARERDILIQITANLQAEGTEIVSCGRKVARVEITRILDKLFTDDTP